MVNKLKNTGFFQWLMNNVKIIQNHQKTVMPSVKIAEVRYGDNAQTPILVLQIPGKNCFFNINLMELLKKEGVLAAFSSGDIETIVTLKIRHALLPQLHLVSHYQEENMTKVIFRDKQGKTLTSSVYQAGKNKEILKKLSAQDNFLLGYLLGSEHKS